MNTNKGLQPITISKSKSSLLFTLAIRVSKGCKAQVAGRPSVPRGPSRDRTAYEIPNLWNLLEIPGSLGFQIKFHSN